MVQMPLHAGECKWPALMWCLRPLDDLEHRMSLKMCLKEVFEEAPSVQAAAVETLISPRQSMASLASLGSYQAPPSAPVAAFQIDAV